MYRSVSRGPRRQRGLSLIEASIVVMIAVAATISMMWNQVEELQIARAEQQGEAIKDIRNAMDNYSVNYPNEIMTGAPIIVPTSGLPVANNLAPTMAELVGLGLLSNGMQNNMYGGSYQISLQLVPAACVPPACNIEGIAVMTTPITGRDGNPSEKLAGYASRKVGGTNGGYASRAGADAPNIIGINGAWTMPNPIGVAGSRPAAVVAGHIFSGVSGLSQFLRRDGTDGGMTGNLGMNGNDITAAGTVDATTVNSTDVNATGTVSAASVNATGSISADQWIAADAGILSNNDIAALNGRIVALNGELVGRDAVVTSATLPGGASPRMTQAVFYTHILNSGGFVSKPTCPAGSTPQVFASASTMATNPPRAIYGQYIQSADVGASWQITLWLYTTASWVMADPAVSTLNASVKCS